MPSPKKIVVDVDYVQRLISEFSKFGAYGETGVWRTAYSPEWSAAADQYASWCSEAGLAVRKDAVGNVWGRLAGRGGQGRSIVSGSHIDSQTPGGRFDGALGALAALVALKTLNQQFGSPDIPLEAVALCEEESSRFPSANFWGSRAITGRISPEDSEKTIGFDGESIATAMRNVGLDPGRIPDAKRDDIDSFIELHIEQGPILEQAGVPVGIVTGITGIRHYLVELRGIQNHAGAFPMDLRRDPMAAFAEIADGVINTAHRWGRPAVTTVGRVTVVPNGVAVIPSEVRFSIDVRHPDPALAHQLYATHEAMMREVAARRQLDIEWQIAIDHEASASAPELVEALNRAADDEGVNVLTMTSGAGHDSQQMAAIAKLAMIFVRSKDGRSHTPEEFSSLDDAVAGIQVLARALHRLAYQ